MEQRTDLGGTDDPEEIAANIVRMRKRRGYSQTDLAGLMRVAGADHWRQTTVSRVETGKQELTFREVRALSAVLGDVTGGGIPGEVERVALVGAEAEIMALKLHALEQNARTAMEMMGGVLGQAGEIRRYLGRGRDVEASAEADLSEYKHAVADADLADAIEADRRRHGVDHEA